MNNLIVIPQTCCTMPQSQPQSQIQPQPLALRILPVLPQTHVSSAAICTAPSTVPSTVQEASRRVFWMTGLSGAGKTTIAAATASMLQEQGISVQIFDGDELRKTISSDLGFSNDDRAEHIRRVALHVAEAAARGIVCICPLITPMERHRAVARSVLPHMHVIHITCPLTVCEQRDVKGLYAKVRAGKVTQYTGISSPFEPPASPDLTLATASSSVEECSDELGRYVLGELG